MKRYIPVRDVQDADFLAIHGLVFQKVIAPDMIEIYTLWNVDRCADDSAAGNQFAVI